MLEETQTCSNHVYNLELQLQQQRLQQALEIQLQQQRLRQALELKQLEYKLQEEECTFKRKL